MDAPERIWAFNAKQTGYRFYAAGPQPEFDNVEFRRADLCADPALLAEAVEVLRGAINGLDWAKIHTAEAGFESVAVNIAHAQVAAFLSKMENRHDR